MRLSCRRGDFINLILALHLDSASKQDAILEADVLRRIRQLGNDFNPPANARVGYQILCGRLEELEQNLQQ